FRVSACSITGYQPNLEKLHRFFPHRRSPLTKAHETHETHEDRAQMQPGHRFRAILMRPDFLSINPREPREAREDWIERLRERRFRRFLATFIFSCAPDGVRVVDPSASVLQRF